MLASATVRYHLQFQLDVNNLAFSCYLQLQFFNRLRLSAGRYKIPCHRQARTYAKRVRGGKMYGGVSTYLPLRVNQAGVIPIIFALSILLFPQLIGGFLAGLSNHTAQAVGEFLKVNFTQGWIYSISYFFLVFIFTYFYTAVTFDPEAIATNLQKSGAFIPGVRPGIATAEHLAKILTRTTFAGAIFLSVVAVLPLAMQTITGDQKLAIGGTALLIVVSVVLDLIKKMDAQLSMREY